MMKYVALDLETTEIDPVSGHRAVEILGFGLASTKKSQALEWTEQNKAQLLQMNEAARRGELMWVFHNASFDVPVLRRHGVDIKPGTYHDTQILCWVWNPTYESYGLDSCCNRYGVAGKQEYDGGWSEWTTEMGDYCEQDVVATINLFHTVHERLHSDDRAYKLYLDVELPYIECIIEFEETGFKIDLSSLHHQIETLEAKRTKVREQIKRLAPPVPAKLEVTSKGMIPNKDCEVYYNKAKQVKLTGEMHQTYVERTIPIDDVVPQTHTVLKRNVKSKRIGGYEWMYINEDGPGEYVGLHAGVGPHCRLKEFNPNSGDQLAYLLYSMYSWTSNKKTKTGKPKTDSEELEWLVDSYPLVATYLDLSTVSKMLDSFLLKFDKLVEPDGFLRGSFNHTGTKTGRLSASNP